MHQREFVYVLCHIEFTPKEIRFSHIKHVPRFKNQEANELTQIASGYNISKKKLEELIEVKEKLITPSVLPSKSLKSKLVGVEGLKDCKFLKFLEFLPLTICRTTIGEKQL